MPNPRGTPALKSLAQREACENKLKRFLEQQKQTALVGPPPTQTTRVLRSLLDGEKSQNSAKVKKLTVHKRNKVYKPSVGRREKEQRTVSKVDSGACTASMWDSVTTNYETEPNQNLTVPVTSTGTLDDLLQPIQLSTRRVECKNNAVNKLSLGGRMNVLLTEKRKKIRGSDCKPNAPLEKHLHSDAKAASSPEESILKEDRLPLHLPGFRDEFNLKSSFHKKKPRLENRFVQVNPKERNAESLETKLAVPPISNLFSTPCGSSELPNKLNDLAVLPKRTLDRSFENSNSDYLAPTTSIDSSSNTQSNFTKEGPSNRSLTIISLPSSGVSSLKTNTKKRQKTSKNDNDNFVRLNLRNKAGSCKGARNLKNHNRQKKWRAKMRDLGGNFDDDNNNDTNICDNEESDEDHAMRDKNEKQRNTTVYDVIDPIDDFLDGTFHRKQQNENDSEENNRTMRAQRTPQHPICTAHNRQCKLLIVKKNLSGNKGRKFYACSLPKGEQCNFFQWADDTVEVTQTELLRSSSHSGFVARQIAAHIDRFRALTVPELRIVAKERRLDSAGNKKELITRLSVWVRDELCKNFTISSQNGYQQNGAKKIDLHIESNLSCSDGEDSNFDENEELEICVPAVGNSSLKNFQSPLHKCLHDLFGYLSFREGQEWAIRRCLRHEKTLLVAPTGMGKSLCYALPASLMDGICIVISPLLSLIADQLAHIPPKLPSATLSGNVTKKDMALIIDDLLKGRLKILFLSPEKLTSAAFRRLLCPKYNTQSKKYERQLPPVSLLCLDEAHCLSQWGHNFRPSYLQIKSIIDTVDPKSVLALTATAGPPVINDICSTLKIPHPKSCNKVKPFEPCVKVIDCNRENIDVSALFLHDEDQRLQMLLKLIQDPINIESKTSGGDNLTKQIQKSGNSLFHQKMEGCLSKGSVIIYVWRKKDAEVITEQLQSAGINGGVMCYHGGMDSNARSRAQAKFMRGKVRIIVATVAFGLGINKADVKGVIHLCLPSSPENYQQEIGRAGRDGKKAQAIALCLRQELVQKYSLSFSDTIAESQIKTFLTNVQYLVEKASQDNSLTNSCAALSEINVAIPLGPMMKSTDLKEETILTILSILGDASPKYPKILDIQGIIPDLVSVTLKKRSIEDLASKEAIGRCIMNCGTRVDARSSNSNPQSRGGTAMQYGFTAYSFETIEFSVTQCSRLLGPNAEPRNVYASLRRLQNGGELDLNFKDHGRSVFMKMSQEGLNYFTNRDLNDSDSSKHCLNALKISIAEYFSHHGSSKCQKVLWMYQILHQMSLIDVRDESLAIQKSKRLHLFHKMMQNFFIDNDKTENFDIPDEIYNLDEKDVTTMRLLSANVMVLVQSTPISNSSCSFLPSQVEFGCSDYLDYTAILITKIFHGIPTPSKASADWYNHHLWGTWRQYNFTSLLEHVKKILDGGE